MCCFLFGLVEFFVVVRVFFVYFVLFCFWFFLMGINLKTIQLITIAKEEEQRRTIVPNSVLLNDVRRAASMAK